MATFSVATARSAHRHRFSLPPASPTIPYPTFQSLCAALVDHLSLSTTPTALASPANTPFHILPVGLPGPRIRIVDDLSFRTILDRSPADVPHLRLRVLRAKPPRLPRPPTPPIPADQPPCDPPVHLFSPSSLLAMLAPLRTDASPSVSSALAALDRALKCHPSDATALRRRRHELAKTFSTFLAEAALPGDRRIPARLTEPFMEDLAVTMRSASVNNHTIDIALSAVSAVCNCKPAVQIVRARYAEAVCPDASHTPATDHTDDHTPDSAYASVPDAAHTAVMPASTIGRTTSASIRTENRPVKHYINQFTRMRCVAGKDVKDAYRRFQHARRCLDDMPRFCLSRRLCKGIQRAAFHFLRCHVSSPNFQFEQRAVQALADSIVRKLIRAGYDDRLVAVTLQLVIALAVDEEVLRLSYGWVRKLMEDSNTGEGGGDPDQLADADHHDDADDSGELEVLAEAAEERAQSEASRRSRSSRSSRRQSVHADELMGGEVGSNESLASVESLREELEEQHTQAMQKKMSEISPVHSSEELSPMERINGRLSGSEGQHSSSSDTDKSQWARVQMAREQEEMLRKARELDRRRAMQMARERQVDLDLARARRRDEETERQMSRDGYGSQRRSRGPSHSGSTRGGSLRGGSVQGGSIRSSRRGSRRSSHHSMSVRDRDAEEYESSRAGTAYVRAEDPRGASESYHGSRDPRQEGSFRGSDPLSVYSTRSRGRSIASARESVDRSMNGSRVDGSVLSSRRGSTRY